MKYCELKEVLGEEVKTLLLYDADNEKTQEYKIDLWNCVVPEKRLLNAVMGYKEQEILDNLDVETFFISSDLKGFDVMIKNNKEANKLLKFAEANKLRVTITIQY